MQFAAEAFILAASAGAFGLVLARCGMQFLTSLMSADMPWGHNSQFCRPTRRFCRISRGQRRELGSHTCQVSIFV